MDRIEELTNQARLWAVDRAGDDPIPEIAELIEASGGIERARLHEARAKALQATDPSMAEADLLAAAAIYAREGLASRSAAIAASAAMFAELGGAWARGIEHAIGATVQLEEVELDDADVVLASTSLAGFYGHMAAFELGLPFGRRAVSAVASVDGLSSVPPMFNLSYMCIEAFHAADEADEPRTDYLDEAETLAVRIAAVEGDEIASVVLAGALQAEIALLRGNTAAASAALEPAIGLSERVAPTFRPWFDFVRASVHAAEDNLEAALPLLDDALIGLEEQADDHCLLRALALRADVRQRCGDAAGAIDDHRRRGDLARRWQIQRTNQFAQLVAAQAELERDGSILRRQAGELVRAATEDPLTGLYSRRWLSRRVAELEAIGSNGSILLVDIDHFKVINDTHGHRVGDQVLTAVSDVLRASFRDGDVVRYGGEEFLVPLLTDGLTAAAIAERARMAVAHASFDEIVPDLRLTISIGIAAGSMTRIRELIDAADDALYVAKQSGRNRVVAADPLG